MPPPWRRALIELYGDDGHDGTWVVEPPDGAQGLEAESKSSLTEQILSDPRYEGADVLYAEDGEDLVIGVFFGATRPRRLKRGRSLPEDVTPDPDDTDTEICP
ncbi:MAG: hypothetical protein D6693_05230 [Planctomycetota bacterium]|nr:MAG: hypothetical protein D6693_05230 [Planctomycetota bacterium]